MFKKLWNDLKAKAIAGYWALKADHFPLWVAMHVFVGLALILTVVSLAN